VGYLLPMDVTPQPVKPVENQDEVATVSTISSELLAELGLGQLDRRPAPTPSR
jgi:hypothetical protein